MEENKSIDKHMSLRITRLFMNSIGMWCPKNSRQKITSNFIVIYTVIFIGLIIMLIDIYYIRGDLRAIVFNLPVTITIIQELIKMAWFIRNINDVYYLNSFTEKNFWKFKYDSSDLSILEKCNRQCILSCVTFFIFILAIDIHYIFIPMIESDKYNGTGRQLPFNMYFKFNEITPFYEIFYFIQSAATIGVSICTAAFISHLFTFNIYAAGQFKILQRKISMTRGESTCNDIVKKSAHSGESTDSYKNLKECILHHQMLIKYMSTIEKLYCPITLIFAAGAVCTICLTGFQLVVGVNMTFHRTALSIEFFVASIIMLFMSCYCCQAIIIESSAIADAAYCTSWYDKSNEGDKKAFKQALMFMMLRSREACVVTVGKLAPMSIEIFAAVFNKSISFFTVLRKTLDES